MVPTPNFPTYVSNAATLGMTTALVLGHLFPREANRYLGGAQEFGESDSGRGSTSGATWRQAGRSGVASPRRSSSGRNMTAPKGRGAGQGAVMTGEDCWRRQQTTLSPGLRRQAT